MESSNASKLCNAQQLELFDRGQTLVEISVSALTTEPELHDIGRALVTLTRYYAEQTGEVES